jgi:hypothetical protein
MCVKVSQNRLRLHVLPAMSLLIRRFRQLLIRTAGLNVEQKSFGTLSLYRSRPKQSIVGEFPNVSHLSFGQSAIEFCELLR